MYKATAKRFTFILLASQIVIFCFINFSYEEKSANLKKLLPKEIKTVTFGTPLDSFLKERPNAKEENQTMDFRHVYIEEINSGNITSAVYYFDADLPGKPLYEIIVNFKDEATMELQANVLLGPSNYSGKDGNSKEWKFDLKKEEYPVHSWTFKNKIVYVMPLSGTEWNTNGNIELE
ncbi:MAG: hypothetical protein HWE21_11875 [Cytophagia bacterium]|nr:hypothetical protein [Cytophagia bacterium]